MMQGAGVRYGRLGTRLGAVALALSCVLAVLLVDRAAAATPPVPDSACSDEASYRSTAGDHTASLLIINNTTETVQSIWLDYTGKRVFYRQIAPLTSYVQPTFLTHPWIIANLAGACYRFVVMNAPQQTVTVNPGDGPPVVTASPPDASDSPPAAPGPASSSSSSVGPHNQTPPVSSSVPAKPATSITTKSKSSGPSVPVLMTGAAAATAAAAAAWWALHNAAQKKAEQQKAEDEEADRVMNEINAELDKIGTGHQQPDSDNGDDADADPDDGGPPPHDLLDDPGGPAPA